MPTWTAKDPDAVLDYLYTIPLDAGDSVASHVFTKQQGDVVIDDEDRTGADITVRLSGGTEGETAVFHVSWATTAGREDEDIITLAIISTQYEPLVLTGYAKPGVAHLIMRYPAFADVEPTTIAYWLTDAERYVDESWGEGDYAAGLMALAAHNMSLAGLGTDAAAASGIPAGVTRFKSAALDVTFADGAASDRVTGSLNSTRYGTEYAALLRRNRGGARVTPTGTIPYTQGHYVDGGA